MQGVRDSLPNLHKINQGFLTHQTLQSFLLGKEVWAEEAEDKLSTEHGSIHYPEQTGPDSNKLSEDE